MDVWLLLPIVVIIAINCLVSLVTFSALTAFIEKTEEGE